MNPLHAKQRKTEIIFWTVAASLLFVLTFYTVLMLRFLLTHVTLAVGEGASSAPLLVHFDFATLDQVLRDAGAASGSSE
jgi:hypothetical protein